MSSVRSNEFHATAQTCIYSGKVVAEKKVLLVFQSLIDAGMFAFLPTNVLVELREL